MNVRSLRFWDERRLGFLEEPIKDANEAIRLTTAHVCNTIHNLKFDTDDLNVGTTQNFWTAGYDIKVVLNQGRPNNGLHGSIARRTPKYLISNDNPRLVSKIGQYGTSTMVHRN